MRFSTTSTNDVFTPPKCMRRPSGCAGGADPEVGRGGVADRSASVCHAPNQPSEPLQMARTKQTARMSTGGKPPVRCAPAGMSQKQEEAFKDPTNWRGPPIHKAKLTTYKEAMRKAMREAKRKAMREAMELAAAASRAEVVVERI